MSAYKSLTALAASTLALAAAAGSAQAQTPYYSGAPQYGQPGGSFSASCRNVQSLENGYISAECQTQGGYRWSAIRQVDCRSDIANRDGVLTCLGATATVGPLYEEQTAYPPQGQPIQNNAGPGGIFGAILGAIFGDAFGNDQAVEDDWNQGRRPLQERRAQLETRIEAGIRDGSISRSEAARLRVDYDDLIRLEARYTADGRLTTQERDDLRSRYRALAQQVRQETGPGMDDGRDWRPLRDREAEFSARIEAAVRARTLDWNEARRLDQEFAELVRLEARYDDDGLSRNERAQLDNDYRALEARIPTGGWNDGGGWNDWRPLSERRVEFDNRLEAGLRARTLTRIEASRLQTDFQQLVRLEADYGRNGVSAQEQADLAARYADLERRIGDGGYDGGYDDGYGTPSSGPAAQIEARIVAAERSGAIDRNESARLRAELGDLVRLEAAYASDGLNAAERDYVSRRYAELTARIGGSRW